MPPTILTTSGALWQQLSEPVVNVTSFKDSKARGSLAGHRKHSAFLHHYKPTTERLELLKSERRTILMEPSAFACGGVCEAFRMCFIEQDGQLGPPQVAKRYQFKEGTQGFREDHVNWYTASLLVKPFNDLLASCCPRLPPIQLLPITRLMEVGGQWYSVEDFIEGTFRKYNNIFGDVERHPWGGEDTTYFDLAAAFSHFSYCHSNRAYVVLDIQGVGATYTDCAVVSQSQSRYGYTDTGASGVQNFLQKHVCNDICHRMGLPLEDPSGAMSKGFSPRKSRLRVKTFSGSQPSPFSFDFGDNSAMRFMSLADTAPSNFLLSAPSPMPWEHPSPRVSFPSMTSPFFS